MPELTIRSADGVRTQLQLTKDRLTIGRSRESDVFLPDQWLSRHHAEILLKDDTYFLADLGSKNGTLLNGERVRAEQRLRSGDVITLGEHTLTFSSEEDGALDDAPEPAGYSLELSASRLCGQAGLSQISLVGPELCTDG